MKLLIALTAAALLTAPSIAANCRDAKGKFTKCPTATAVATANIAKGKDGKCRWTSGKMKGKFAKCP